MYQVPTCAPLLLLLCADSTARHVASAAHLNLPMHSNPFSCGRLAEKHNSNEVCWGWWPEKEEGKRGLVRGGEGVKGVCVWRLIGKNADKPAPRILLA